MKELNEDICISIINTFIDISTHNLFNTTICSYTTPNDLYRKASPFNELERWPRLAIYTGTTISDPIYSYSSSPSSHLVTYFFKPSISTFYPYPPTKLRLTYLSTPSTFLRVRRHRHLTPSQSRRAHPSERVFTTSTLYPGTIYPSIELYHLVYLVDWLSNLEGWAHST